MKGLKEMKLKYFVLFLVLIYGFTALSNFIEYYTLPQVELAKTTSGTLLLDFHKEATVKIQSQDVVYASCEGKIDSIDVQEGSKINAGDKVMTYNLASLNETLENVNRNIASLENDLAVFRLKMNNDSIDHLHQKYVSNQKLYDNGVISKKDLEDSYKSYMDGLNNQQVSSKEYNQSIIDKENQLKDKEKERRDLQDLIDSEGVVYGMENGVISQVNVSKGQLLKGNEILMSYEAESSERHVEVSIDEDIAKFYERGDVVSIESPTEKDHFNGVISSIKVDEKRSNSRLLTITFDSSLTSGQLVDVTGDKQSKKYPIVISSQAIVTEDNKSYVWLIKTADDGKTYLNKSAIIIGDADEKKTVVEDGLNAKDEIVVQVTNEKILVDGERVIVKE